MEGLGEEGRVSVRFPMLESLFSRASRTWPTSVFSIFAKKKPTTSVFDEPRLPTPDSSSDNSPPSLDTDISSTDPNNSPDTSLDNEWAYPLTPPPLPSLEVPQITIRPLPVVPENPEVELPALDLPLRQFEDLQVGSNNTSESGKGDEVGNNDTSNVPVDVEMENVEYHTHQNSADNSTILQDDEEDIRAHHSTSLPPIDTISNAPPVNEDDELDQGEETPEDAQNLTPPSPYFDPDVWKELDPAHLTQNQRNSAHQMRLVLSRLQAHMLLLTSVHFGSRSSHRSFHRLHEAIPQSALQQFFPDYETHADLAKAISTVQANQRKEPNCWQTHIPHIRRIRQLLDHFMQAAHNHVRNHGYLDGLKEYCHPT